MAQEEFQNQYFKKAQDKASNLLKDRERLQILLINATRKLKQLSVKHLNFDKLTQKIMIIVRMLKAYISGEYRVIPWKSLIVLVAALIYFVAPLDLIPDFIPVSGYLDDFTVILWVFRSLQEEINDFISWESTS